MAQAGRWFLDSGIQEASGGVARYYRSEIRSNKPVSTEITGYVASTLVYLFDATGDGEYLERARMAGGYLLNCAWDESLRTFPFEPASHLAWFFDCGIIIRGLLAIWRRTREDRLLAVARAASHAMVRNFDSGEDYHPVLALPAKTPLPRTAQWSRAPGCYQLKAALAWLDVAEATGDEWLRASWLELLEAALATHRDFLTGLDDQHLVMDRLHAYCYFLEGLTPVLDRDDCVHAFAWGVAEVSRLLREIAPSFVRSDVYAQLLRTRIQGARALKKLDACAAAEEANALAGFQAISDDPRIHGGFLFGRRDGELSPHVNPVSTAFGLQALEMWRLYRAGAQFAGTKSACHQTLI
jgi:hypothetical protein